MAILNDTIIRGNLYLKKDDINVILGNSKIKAVTVSSDRLIYGDSNYFTDINAKALSINSNTTINGNLTVTGDTEMESIVMKSLSVDDGVTTRLLTVTENSVLSTTIIGTSSSNKNLTVNGSIATSGNLSVSGTSSLGTTIIGTSSSNKNITVNGNLSVSGTSSLGTTIIGTSSSNKNITVNGNLSVSGTSSLGTTIIGTSSSNKNLTVNGNITTSGNITPSGQIKRNAISSSWIGGRDTALVKLNTINGYSVINSVKTNSGSWEIGSYDYDPDKLLFTYISDSKCSSNNNTYDGQIKFLNDSSITADLNGNASSASKLNADDAGSVTNPIYFKNGIPVACTYSLNKTVPSDAVFTDTTYEDATQSSSGLMSAADKKKLDGAGTNTATQSSPGLMSAEDKKKLDSLTSTITGIEFGIMEVGAASNYNKTYYTFNLRNTYNNYFINIENDEEIDITISEKNTTSFTIYTRGTYQGGTGAKKIGYCIIGN